MIEWNLTDSAKSIENVQEDVNTGVECLRGYLLCMFVLLYSQNSDSNNMPLL